MMRLRIRPHKDMFDSVIRLFADMRQAAKVEEWLLNAGQSGWTPEQGAFEAVVVLYAEAQLSVKAEEWLSRALQTEYRLPDACFAAVVEALLRSGSSAGKANEWLARMLAEGRSPDEALLAQVAAQLIEIGDLAHAEERLLQLPKSYPADGLRRSFFDMALHAGDPDRAEEQLHLLSDGGTDPHYATRVALAFVELGAHARVRAVFDWFCAQGGSPSVKLSHALLTASARASDTEGAALALRLLANNAPLSDSQARLFMEASRVSREAPGAARGRALAFLRELGFEATLAFDGHTDHTAVESGVVSSGGSSTTTCAGSQRISTSEGYKKRPPSTTSAPKMPATREGGASTFGRHPPLQHAAAHRRGAANAGSGQANGVSGPSVGRPRSRLRSATAV